MKLDESLKQLREKRMRDVNDKLNKARDQLQRAENQENKDDGRIRELESARRGKGEGGGTAWPNY